MRTWVLLASVAILLVISVITVTVWYRRLNTRIVDTEHQDTPDSFTAKEAGDMEQSIRQIEHNIKRLNSILTETNVQQ